MKQLLLITTLFFAQLSFGQTSDFCKSCTYTNGIGYVTFCYLYSNQANMTNSSCPTTFVGLSLISETNNFAGCPPNICFLTQSLLPVELLDFSGDLFGNKIILKWSTVSEKNNKGFEIQKSSDGLEWKKIDFIDGLGNKSEITTYTFKDTSEVNENNYYRLKQLDETGVFTFSEVIKVSVDNNNNTNLIVYPNPVSDYVGVRNITGNVNIFDSNGKLVSEQEINVEGSNIIQLNQLSNGIYIVQITDKNGKIYSKKIIKQ